MKLRGGLAGLPADQVATGVMGLAAINSVVMGLAPKKAGEMYGVADTKWNEFFAQWFGIICFGQALSAYLALGGMDMATAIGWGFIPSVIFALQDLLNDRMVGQMGMNTAAKYAPPLINLLFTLGCFNKIPGLDPEMTLKLAAIWMGANGLFGYLSTDTWLEGWGGSGLSAVESGMGKLFASSMVGGASYLAANIFFGKNALESYGVMLAVYLLTNLDSMYLSKTMEAMGVDSTKGLFWAGVQALGSASIFF
jgi:hypothetical protein